MAELLVQGGGCEIHNGDKVAEITEHVDPEMVIHLAVQSLGRQGYQDPKNTLDVNIMRTVNMLEIIRRRRKPCAVIIVTSDKCYDNARGGRPHAENDPMGGNDPYSASKRVAELVVAAYRRSYFDPEHVDRYARRKVSQCAWGQRDRRWRLGRGSCFPGCL